MSFQRILCPIDFSATSGDAARYAAAIARRESAELTLLHAAPAIDFEFALAAPQLERLAFRPA
jgi:nucleotide-binding universal stress UspA family protein